MPSVGGCAVTGALVTSSVLLVLTLTGCAAVGGGTSADEVATAVERHLQVSRVVITPREVSQTFDSTTIVVITADQPRSTVNDLLEFTEELLEAAYTVRDRKPTAGVRIVLRGYDGAPLGGVLEQSGWKVVGWDESAPGAVFVPFSELQEHFGGWPGRADLVR